MPEPAGGATLRGILAGIGLVVVVGAALLVILSRDTAADRRIATPTPPDVALTDAGATPLPEGEGEARVGSGLLEQEPEEREPTDVDAAAFSAAYEPADAGPVELVTTDLDGDGRAEVVAAFVAGGYARIEVAAWDGRAFGVVFAGQGGPAGELLSLEVRDLTGDGRREIATRQATERRESLALWAVGEEGVQRLAVRGGCWDGSHVVGHDGAEIDDGELIATCPPATAGDGGVARGGRDVYTWDGQTWTHEPTE